MATRTSLSAPWRVDMLEIAPAPESLLGTAERSPAQLIKDEIVKQGFKLVAAYPDHRMSVLLRELREEPSLRYLPLAREEEGIGVCAGAFCGGMKAILVMPNSGFLTCSNAISGISVLCG